MAHKCDSCVWCRRIDENRIFCRRVRCVKVNRFERDINILENMDRGLVWECETDQSVALEIAIKVLRAEG